MSTYFGRRGLTPNRHRWTDALSRLDGHEFEVLMARYYESQGFRVEHVGTGGGARRYDGGIDLKLFRGEEIWVVQCKQHTAYQIPHNDVHQLVGVRATQRATGAIFITTGEYKPAVLRIFNAFPSLQLIDGHEVRRMLGPMLYSLPAAPAGVPTARNQATGPRRPPVPRWLGLVVPVLVILFAWLGVKALQGMLRADSAPDAVVESTAPGPTQAGSANPEGVRQARPILAPIANDSAVVPTHAVDGESEAKRRADAAMDVLEESTPEM